MMIHLIIFMILLITIIYALILPSYLYSGVHAKPGFGSFRNSSYLGDDRYTIHVDTLDAKASQQPGKFVF